MRVSRSINQLAGSSGKAYANVHAVATALIAENILMKETVGHSHQCRLNLSNDKTLLYLSLLETVKRDNLLRDNQDARRLLGRIDATSPELGTLLAWKREHDLLLVTTTIQDSPNGLFDIPVTMMPLAAFLNDKELRATIGAQGTLLFGHALYVGLLKERSSMMDESRETKQPETTRPIITLTSASTTSTVGKSTDARQRKKEQEAKR